MLHLAPTFISMNIMSRSEVNSKSGCAEFVKFRVVARPCNVNVAGDTWPKATPKSVITKLNGAVVEALADPAVRRRLADVGQEMYPREQQTPEALSAYQSAEIGKWWPIIREANIKAE